MVSGAWEFLMAVTFFERGYFVFMGSCPLPFAELGFEADFIRAPGLELHPLSQQIVGFPLIFHMF
jgi:hypothetical protein